MAAAAAKRTFEYVISNFLTLSLTKFSILAAPAAVEIGYEEAGGTNGLGVNLPAVNFQPQFITG